MHIVVRPLREDDLPEADRIFRLAFGTFVGLPDPTQFAGDSDWIATTWRRDPDGAFAAEVDGCLVGSNFATGWGKVGFFGPLSVRPDLWDRGIARRLLEPVMECFARWGTRHDGLFTFAQSSKHVGLYQRFGFYPRFLTAIMMRRPDSEAAGARTHVIRFADVPAHEREQYLGAIREVTDAVFGGLDLTRDVHAILEHQLGDTLLAWDGSQLAAVALCHVGAGTQAGSGTCYVKFAAARPGSGVAERYEHLLDAIESYAAARGAAVVAGVNLAREDAYRRLLARGYRTAIQGVAMHRPNESGYSRPDAYVLDDWR